MDRCCGGTARSGRPEWDGSALTNLTGANISGIPNTSLVNSAVTVNAGSGLDWRRFGFSGRRDNPFGQPRDEWHVTGNGGSNALGINLGNANTWTAAQTFTPSAAAATGVIVRQASGGTVNVFDVQNNGGECELPECGQQRRSQSAGRHDRRDGLAVGPSNPANCISPRPAL